jgi:uroporphyrinogen-III synthase
MLFHTAPSIINPLAPEVHGSHTGTGERLAEFILAHYPTIFRRRSHPPQPQSEPHQSGNDGGEKEQSLPPLLFLVGEQRRDIIPKTLTSQRIPVTELVVYETGIMPSFASDFDRALQSCTQLSTSPSHDASIRKAIVIVVFSPSGCAETLKRLGFLDENGKATGRAPTTHPEARYVVATIGPTTRDYLKKEFTFEADVCAEKPSPEGVGEGVTKHLKEHGLL